MKRDLFEELKEGYTALQEAREDKITLRTHMVEKNLLPPSHRKSSVIHVKNCTCHAVYLHTICTPTSAP